MTKVFKSQSLWKTLNKIKEPINFVPTMGNLHLGHQELIKKATRKNAVCLVSIFVNPLQFSEKKDFEKYPKTIEKDLALIKKLGVDYLFLPGKDFIDKKKMTVSVSSGQFSNLLCGLDRPGHFDGVTTIVSKLLNVIRPDNIFLGEKDFQQLFIIKRLANELSFRTKVISVNTLREKDGLAYSSRNNLLSNKKRKLASEIYNCLISIKGEIKKGKFEDSRFTFFKKKLINIGFEKVNYIEIRDEESLSEIKGVAQKSRLFISVVLEGIRLIDNIKIGKLKKFNERFKSCD